MSKHYVRSDGNGGIKISHTMVAAFGVILVCIGMLISSGLAYGSLNEKVDTLSANYAEAGPRHTAVIQALDNRIDAADLERSVAVTKLDRIEKDISEIKDDVKIIKNSI